MAKVRKNLVIEGLSGSLGDQLVIKIGKGGQTIISAKPKFTAPQEFTAAQTQQHDKFREGAAYAKQTAQTEPLYAAKAEGTPLNAYNVAMADFLHPPEIPEINATGYTGKAGETILVQAKDDVLVKKVTVVIADNQDNLIEQGEATAGQGFWWSYQTTVTTTASNVKIIAHAWDMPGHETTAQA